MKARAYFCTAWVLHALWAAETHTIYSVSFNLRQLLLRAPSIHNRQGTWHNSKLTPHLPAPARPSLASGLSRLRICKAERSGGAQNAFSQRRNKQHYSWGPLKPQMFE